jgi:hypothetical protein
MVSGDTYMKKAPAAPTGIAPTISATRAMGSNFIAFYLG